MHCVERRNLKFLLIFLTAYVYKSLQILNLALKFKDQNQKENIEQDVFFALISAVHLGSPLRHGKREFILSTFMWNWRVCYGKYAHAKEDVRLRSIVYTDLYSMIDPHPLLYHDLFTSTRTYSCACCCFWSGRETKGNSKRRREDLNFRQCIHKLHSNGITSAVNNTKFRCRMKGYPIEKVRTCEFKTMVF